jgi:EAL domain-containing protein (putative c-di-GMP-specific phosphodiesterase class I)
MQVRGLKSSAEVPDGPTVTLSAELEHSRRTRAAIEALIATPQMLGPDFQPIRRFSDGELVGYKATGRGAPGTEVGDTLSLLRGAQSLGLVERLDWSFRCHAFDVAVDAGLDVPVHLTPEPETFGSMCPPRLAVSFSRGRRELTVVAEIHEDSLAEGDRLRAAIDEMRGWGWRFSLADLADVPAASSALGWIAPAFVQVDLSTPGRLDQPAVRRWLDSAGEHGVEVMALGVDSAALRDEAVAAGATCGRGAVIGAAGDLPPR